MTHIHIKGAREHNLKNVDLSIPKNKLVVFTGLSGSGKSSMAFDTIYAEGQRRYVESLSSYARQFLGILGKPDADFIEGLSPSISIDQKSVSHNRRSTVGTTTEIYDYLRLLFARAGHPYCQNCGKEITKLSVDEISIKIVDMIVSLTKIHKHEPIQIRITSPIIRDRKGEYSGLFDNLRSKGYTHVLIDGRAMSLDDDIHLIKTNKHSIDAIIDTIRASASQMKEITDSIFLANLRSRIFTAVEQAVSLSGGLVYVYTSDTDKHLYSENFSCPDCNIALPEIEPRMFSFNSPIGACETCKGLGNVVRINPDLLFSKNLTINEGGILPYKDALQRDSWFSRTFKVFAEEEGIDLGTPLHSISEKHIELLLNGSKKTYAVKGHNKDGKPTTIHEKWVGIIPELERRYAETQSDYARNEVERFMTEKVCETCEGKRLKPEVLSIKLNQFSIFDVCNLSIEHSLEFFKELPSYMTEYEKEVSKSILTEVNARLQFLINVGLSYLTLNRSSRTLSGGESQRIRLASQIGSGLSGVIYVLDEPSIGLHPRDVSALVDSLKKLRELGNTIIVVEHDLETIVNADHIIDFGPEAGKYGGTVVYEGDLKGMESADTLTADYIYERKVIQKRKPSYVSNGSIHLKGAKQYNLKDVSAEFPLGHLIGVTGVSGSGKSTLVVETLYKGLQYYLSGRYEGIMGEFSSIDGYQYIDNVYLVNQSPIGRTPRSNPATYIGAFDLIRDIFAQTPDAKMRGYKKGRFSFNVKGGRCEKCSGAGSIKVEMQFLPDVYVTCDVCEGKRYNSETLDVKYKSKNIYEVLSMTVDDAVDFFSTYTQLSRKLRALKDIGLGYLEVGRPAPTLSGGEAQRIKLAFELARKEEGRTLYIFDEPTTGLHPHDISKLLKGLYELVHKGNTVIVIEHNLDVIKNMDYIIDMGPSGGEGGGRILYQGKPEGILHVKESSTAHFLQKEVL